MLSVETAQGTAFPITWIGISDLDGSLRFEVDMSDSESNCTPHSANCTLDMSTLFATFSDPAHTRSLTRVFDEDRKIYDGFTVFKGIERMGTGNIVVRLMPTS